MPIAVRCACGKSINAPDQLAGKKAKCPACGEALSIPAAAGASQGAAPKAASSSSGAERPIYVTCECGKKFTAPAKLAGKSVQCPTCRQLVKLPKASDAGAASAKPSKDGVGDLLDEVDLGRSRTGHRCPECRADLQPDDILCIQCGYNLESGKKLVTKKIERKAKLGGHGHGHGGGGGKPAGPPKQEKTKETAPPAIKGLVKLLQLVGNMGLLAGMLIAAYLGYRAYQANPQQDYMELANGLVTSALPVLGGFVVLLTVPATAAVGMLYQGKPAGRILAIIVGILGLPLVGLGALVLRGAFSDDVSRYCSG